MCSYHWDKNQLTLLNFIYVIIYLRDTFLGVVHLGVAFREVVILEPGGPDSDAELLLLLMLLRGYLTAPVTVIPFISWRSPKE